MLPIYY